MAKKDWCGILFFICGVILFGFTSVGTVVSMSFLEGWSNPPGKYWSAIQQGRLMFPMIFSWVLMSVGLVFIFSNELKNLYIRLSN